jgi:N-acetylneuraminate synthase
MNIKKSFTLNNGKEIIEHGKPYFIAELNSSHFGNIEYAQEMITEAKNSGADCVKFQSWSSTSLYCDSYYKANPIAERFVKKFSLSVDDFVYLSNFCKKIGIDFASTPYSESEVDYLLDRCDVPFIKIASMEINNHNFLNYIASKETAIILSTGMSTYDEIIKAVEVIKKAGNKNLSVLHCVSVYPLSKNLANLNNIIQLRDILIDLPIGYSDHTTGPEAAIASTALGCPIIEKHFTLDNSKIGMDNQMATMPNQFKDMVDSCNLTKSIMGSFSRELSEEESQQRTMMRRSVVSKDFIAKDKIITSEDLSFKRPGNGIPPTDASKLIGKRALHNIEAGELLDHSDFV